MHDTSIYIHVHVHVYAALFICMYSVRLGSRMLTRRVMSQGIFAGAVVRRGADWRWGDQDGVSNRHTYMYMYLTIFLRMYMNNMTVFSCIYYVHEIREQHLSKLLIAMSTSHSMY